MEKHWGYSPEQIAPSEPNRPDAWAGALRINEWTGTRTFAKTGLAPDWLNISPRVGFAYDLFGDGSTAVKMSAGRFVCLLYTSDAADE